MWDRSAYHSSFDTDIAIAIVTGLQLTRMNRAAAEFRQEKAFEVVQGGFSCTLIGTETL